MGIVAMVLDLKHFQNFHREAVNGVKMLLFRGGLKQFFYVYW